MSEVMERGSGGECKLIALLNNYALRCVASQSTSDLWRPINGCQAFLQGVPALPAVVAAVVVMLCAC